MDSGEVTSIVGDQVVVKVTGKLPAMGTAIFTSRTKIGVVADIIGSVEKPYFVVKTSPNAKVAIGDRLRSN